MHRKTNNHLLTSFIGSQVSGCPIRSFDPITVEILGFGVATIEIVGFGVIQ